MQHFVHSIQFEAKDMSPTAGDQNIRFSLGGQLTAKGRDLVYTLTEESFITK